MTQVGSSVGHIRLEALLGAGGMGEVYQGFDEKLQRVVAVKTIRADHRLSEDTKARFLREARILSKLAHPAICQIFDLVETPEADWLVIEFVEGQTLADLRRHRELGETEILRIALAVAGALAAAHRERIVHRDLKPDNIMVGPTGAVKILDFGIARSVQEEGGEGRERIAAAVGAELIDADQTIAFGSTLPASGSLAGSTAETQLTQAGWILGTARYMSPEQAAGLEVGEASDMFSLGIVLQELLTRKAAYQSAPLAHTVAMVAANKSLPVEGLDLDVTRLIEDLKHPVPERRPTAEQTVERLRWLLDRPARERRRRLQLIAASSAFALLTVVLVVVSVLAIRAERARERADLEAATANEVALFLERLFDAADPETARGREVTAEQLVEKGAERVGRELSGQPLVQARLEHVLGRISLQIGDPSRASELLSRALATRRELLAPDDPSTADTLANLGAVAVDQDRFEEATALLEEARAIFAASGDREQLAVVLNQLGILAANQGHGEKAIALLRQSLELREQIDDADPADLISNLNNLGILAWQGGDFAAARSDLERALALRREQLEQEESEQAETGRQLSDDHPKLVAQLNNLALLARDEGRLVEAEALHREALDIGERVLGADHPDVGNVLASRGRRLATRRARPGDALPLLERAEGILERAYGAEHREAATVLVRLGDTERRLGRLLAATEHLDLGLARLRSTLGDEHPRLVEALTAKGRLELVAGRAEAGRDALAAARELAERVLGPDHPDTLALDSELAAASIPSQGAPP